MGYYVRAFCIQENIPKLGEVLQWVSEKGSKLSITDPSNKIDLTSSNWSNIEILYKSGKLPILVECNSNKGTNDSLLKQEIHEFLELIGKPRLSIAKRRIVNHLKNTKFIIACQLLTSDIDDDGYNANAAFLDYFVIHCGAIIQADGEGFYKGNRLDLKLD